MDLLEDLFLPALISILLSFLLAHLASLHNSTSKSNHSSPNMPQSSSQFVEPSPPSPKPVIEPDNELKIERIGFPEEDKFVEEEVEVEEDEEWQGIERSEVEKVFGMAMEYVGSERGVEAVLGFRNDVQMELYGLLKVATEGPCREPRPLPFMISARSKWHAWQRLGSMNPDAAMEQYIALLTNNMPGWKDKIPEGAVNTNDHTDPLAVAGAERESSDSGSSLQHGPHCTVERLNSENDADNLVTDSRFKQGLANTILLNLISPPRVTFF